MTSQIARKVVQSFREEPKDLGTALRLTEREEGSLSLLSKGCANKEIAKAMAKCLA